MIIFTVTSKASGQIYVGSTRNDLDSQWEKMVAAAQQDLDYPLYREIRIQGDDQFVVEEWDRAEDRNELAELEEEAISHFNAKSLRGYKTSTVKILPKKKKRQRKSSIEKELASIFTEADDNENVTAPSLTIKTSDTETSPVAPEPAAKPATQPVSQPTPSRDKVKELFQQAIQELKIEEEKQQPAAAKPEPQKSAGSQANATVQMSSIDLSDDISAQLAAITAAADAVLAGDSNAASLKLEEAGKQQPEPEEQPAVTEISTSTPVSEPAELQVVEKPVRPRELRIREAVERHRKLRSQRTSEVMDSERKQMATLLAQLDARARELHTGILAAVA